MEKTPIDLIIRHLRELWEVSTQNILHFLPNVFNGVEIWGVGGPMDGPNPMFLQPPLCLFGIVNRGVVLLEKGPRGVILK